MTEQDDARELELIRLMLKDPSAFEQWVNTADTRELDTWGVSMLETAVSGQNIDAIHILTRRVPASSGSARAIAQRLFDEGLDERGDTLQALLASRTMVPATVWTGWQYSSFNWYTVPVYVPYGFSPVVVSVYRQQAYWQKDAPQAWYQVLCYAPRLYYSIGCLGF